MIVQFNDSRYEPDSVVALDSYLDEISGSLTSPGLAELRGTNTKLSFGIGLAKMTPAFYLDEEGVPWHSVGERDVSGQPPLLLFKGARLLEFDSSIAIPNQEARAAARLFMNAPSKPPKNVAWRREGLS